MKTTKRVHDIKHHLTTRGALEAKEVRRWLARPVERLRRRLTHFPPDAVHLRTLLREAEGKPFAEAVVRLQLPSNTLVVSEEGGDARSALLEAFSELERLLEKEKARLQRRHAWRRSSEVFRKELVDEALRGIGSEAPAEEGDLLQQQLGAVERFVERELGWLEMCGELVQGEIDPGDVVDAALLRAFEKWRKRPTRKQLLQSASSALRVELEQVRASRREIHIEEGGARALRESRATGGTLPYAAEDVLRMADLIPNQDGTPEEFEIGAELGKALREGIAALPARWRQALHLRELEGLDDAAIAETLELEEAELPQLVAHTRAFLRERLAAAGLLDTHAR